MTLIVCSFLLATGAATCSDPMSVNDAVAMTIAVNQTFPFDPRTSKRTPHTLYPADAPPKAP